MSGSFYPWLRVAGRRVSLRMPAGGRCLGRRVEQGPIQAVSHRPRSDGEPDTLAYQRFVTMVSLCLYNSVLTGARSSSVLASPGRRASGNSPSFDI
jgi:hypothetical protein